MYDRQASEKSLSVDVISKGHTMQDKYTHWLQGAAAGTIALAVVGFSWGGWSTASGTAKQVEAAVLTAMVPSCAKEVMADPTAAAELKVKRVSDYDDVVRDHLRRVDDKANRGYQFHRDCGKAIEALMAKMATKS
jgi:alpha/beta superfamily hydrolase